MPHPDEFALIAKIFAPLTKSTSEAFGLKDDAAAFTPPPGEDIVVTKDALVSGVHFLPNDPPDLIAKKLLRVNLSDLAAKGATPLYYLLACAWPREITVDWLRGFADGLAEDQSIFNVGLLGGDTVATVGPLTLSLTAIGHVPPEAIVRRSGARPGDAICVTGTIGDAGLGLQALRGEISLGDGDRKMLIARYQVPQPRLGIGLALRGLASASIDISDGLLADAGHIASESGVGLDIEAALVPFSNPAQTVMANSNVNGSDLMSAGDDYELCFTIPEARLKELLRNVQGEPPITKIGTVRVGSGARLWAEDGEEIVVETSGYRHF